MATDCPTLAQLADELHAMTHGKMLHAPCGAMFFQPQEKPFEFCPYCGGRIGRTIAVIDEPFDDEAKEG